jgi:hypothetical protein
MRNTAQGSAESSYIAGVSDPSVEKHASSSLRGDTKGCEPERDSTATKSATFFPPVDADLALVMDAWSHLPDAVRAGIMAMVRASKT